MCGILICTADPANRTNSPQQKASEVKTIFVTDANLTAQDVKDVLSLAKQCGISQPAEIETFHYLPSTERGISVKSIDSIKGVDITFDTITIQNTAWRYSEPGKNEKRVGTFWATPSDKYTTHLRVYDFRGEKIRINIGTGITTEMADKIIPLIAAKKVRYSDNSGFIYFRDEMKRILDLKPSGIAKPLGGSSKQDGELWLYFGGQLDALQFRFEKGEVILEQVIHINV
jgi:hypothetical protein